jgi:aryl-alcohol dehydrogenase-like predicted oxidoreductase
MSHDWVDVCLSGATTVAQIESNAQAVRLLPLPSELVERLGKAMRQDCEEYWADRRALEWS